MRKYLGLLAATGLATLPAVGMAAAPSVSDVLGASGISAQGYFSGGYTAGSNKGQTLAGHTFDTNSNTFALNQADLALSYLPSSGAGALVETLAGNDAKVVNGSYGSSGGDFSLPQAYLQYATGNLTVIGGRYWTLAGEEVANDAKNTNISRSFLFELAEPFAHTGVRATYKFSDKLSANFGVANSAVGGEASAQQKPKTFEANATFTPNATTSFALTNYYGIDGNPSRNNYLDFAGSFNVTSALQLAVNGDWYKSTPVAAAGASSIYGGAGYLNYTFSDKLKSSTRGEYLKLSQATAVEAANALTCPNNDGKCTLIEATETLDYTVAKNFDVLGEVRYDWGSKIYPDADVLADPTDFSRGQGELEVRAIYKFGTPTS